MMIGVLMCFTLLTVGDVTPPSISTQTHVESRDDTDLNKHLNENLILNREQAPNAREQRYIGDGGFADAGIAGMTDGGVVDPDDFVSRHPGCREHINDPTEIDIQKYIQVQERPSHGKPIPIVARQDGGTQELIPAHAEIPVDIRSDIVVTIAEDIVCAPFAGEIGIRARILRTTPVELNVDNFTTIDQSRNATENPFLVPNYMLRTDPADIDKALVALQVALVATSTDSILTNDLFTLSQGVSDFVAAATLGKTIPSDLEYQRKISDITEMRSRLVTYQTAYDLVSTRATELSTKVSSLFQIDDLLSAISDVSLSRVTPTIYQLKLSTQQRAKQIEVTKKDFQAAAAACDAIGADLKQKLTCLSSFAKTASTVLFQQQLAIKSLTSPLSEGIAIRSLADIRSDFFLFVQDSIKRVRDVVISDYRESFRKRLHSPGTVHLGQITDLKHNEIIELIVHATVDSLLSTSDGFKRSTAQKQDRFVRFSLRAVDSGFTLAPGLQLALVKRIAATTASNEISANFLPTAGVSLNLRLRTRQRWSDWIIPSIGLLALPIHFSQDDSVELGIGPMIGVANDLLHVGVGRDLLIRRHYLYWFLALDFAQGFDVLTGIIGAKVSPGTGGAP